MIWGKLACLTIIFAAFLSMPVAVSVAQATDAVGQTLKESFIAGWDRYRSHFIMPDGRVVDNGNGGISHSEGQGYGMLLSVWADDRTTFDRVWTWTRTELLIRTDGLAVWSWDPAAKPHVKDENNASDGDLLIAWALAEAADRWNDQDLRDRAKAIALGLNTLVIRKGKFGTILLPAVSGFSETDQPDGPVVNLSYWVFPAFARLKPVAPEVDWDGLQKTGLELLRQSQFGPLRVTSDWVALGSGKPAPAQNFKAEFGYNAIRIPLYLAWADIDRRTPLPRYGRMWQRKTDLGPFIIDVATGEAKADLTGHGYRAVVGLADCVETGRKIPAGTLEADDDLYYPSTLLLMVNRALSERRPQCI